METEENQIAKIENFIITEVYMNDKVSMKTLRHELSGFRSPRNPHGNQKITREEVDSIILRLYKKGLVRKQRRFLWIPVSSKTLRKLSELGLIDTKPMNLLKAEVNRHG